MFANATNNFKMAEAVKLLALGENFYASHLLTGNRDDIHEAVRCSQVALDLTSRSPLDSATLTIQYNLAKSSFRRFLATRQAEDITMAIEMFQRASQAAPQLQPGEMQNKCFQYLIISRFVRDDNLDTFLQLNAPDLLSQSLRPSLDIKVLTHDLEKGDVLRYLEKTLFNSAATLGPSVEDLDSKIHLCRKALEFFRLSPNPVIASKILYHTGLLLHFRRSLHGRLEDITEAISCFCCALRMRLPLHLVGPCLTVACDAFIQRYEVLRWQEDLDNAYAYVKQAMKIFDAVHHAKHSMSMATDSPDVGVLHGLNNLARVMRLRYRATGDVNDLNSAVETSSRVVDLAEDSKSNKYLPRFLNSLAESLKFRVQRTGHTGDMRLAIEKLERALKLLPQYHPSRIQSLMQLSWFEGMQDLKLPDGGYAERAGQHFQEALSIIDRSPELQHESEMSFFDGVIATGLSNFPDMKWSEDSEALARENISCDSAYNPRARFSYAVLYSCHISRWKTSKKEINEIDGAINISRSMVKIGRRSPDDMISAWVNLGNCLFERFKSTGDDENWREAVKVLLKGFRRSAGAPFERMRAGKVAIDILSDHRVADWTRARKLCREMVDLLVILNGRSLDWQDKQFWLRQFSSQAALYASIALQAGSDAWDVIDMLETCRGSILGHVIDNRMDLDDLKKAAPEKAERFRTLQDEINAGIDPSGNSSVLVEQIARRDRADREIRALLDEIRKLEGFHRFLLGPSQEEVLTAAAGGPIVIVNISSVRSDAIIITKNGNALLPLPQLEYQKAKGYLDADLTNFTNIIEIGPKNKKFGLMQRWLWENCVKLILAQLQILVSDPTKLHIWWIGVGIANSLPFHASGFYTAARECHESALSRIVSSYTPTLKMLIYGRRRIRYRCPKPSTQGLTKMAIVIMPSTPGHSLLPGVEEESDAVVNIVSGAYSPSVIPKPSADVAQKLMRECEIMHFACHGESILMDPSSSHLLLEATTPNSAPVIDKLKVRDVAVANVSGKLVFLSACSSAQSKLTTLLDEVLHLASGFQVAGFSHAIGNLWPADDKKSVHLVKKFYQHLVDAGELGEGENVAMALNKALMATAKENAKLPLSWAHYVHFGI